MHAIQQEVAKLKKADVMPPFSAEKFMGRTHAMLETQVLYAGIELGIFSRTKNAVSSCELARETGCDERNLELLLNALTAIEVLSKENGKFLNLPETDYYLNPESDMYLGEHILYWRDMTNLGNITELVKNGALRAGVNDKNGSDFFDFRSMGRGAVNTMYLGRVQKFIGLMKEHFEKEQELKVFDMGCGSGIFSIEIARNFPNSRCVAFDQPSVIEFTKEIIDKYGVSLQVNAVGGNFVTDGFEGKYDLIIASGVLDFVGDLRVMAKKITEALKCSGLLYVNTHGINTSFTAPKSFVLGWLSSHLNGLDILKPDAEIKAAMESAGLEMLWHSTEGSSYIMRKKNEGQE